MTQPDVTRAEAGSDTAAWPLRQARSELMLRLQFFALEPERVLDLGAGRCEGTLELARRFPRAGIIAIDHRPQALARASHSLWRRSRYQRVCAEGGSLPLADAGCDLICSNLPLPGHERLDTLFAEWRRVLRPGGLLLFSGFAPDTLQELRSAWASVDAQPHVEEFADLPQVAEALMHAGFIEPVIDVERYRRHYLDLRALQQELRQMGPRHAQRARPSGLGGRARTLAMGAAYERMREAAGLPVTWELLFAAAFAGSPSGQTAARGAARSGEQVIPLERVRGRRHRS